MQVSRLGLPLVNEAIIGLQDKDHFNRTRPRNDLDNFAPYFLFPVIVRNAEAVGLYTELGMSAEQVASFKTGAEGNNTVLIATGAGLVLVGAAATVAVRRRNSTN